MGESNEEKFGNAMAGLVVDTWKKLQDTIAAEEWGLANRISGAYYALRMALFMFDVQFETSFMSKATEAEKE